MKRINNIDDLKKMRDELKAQPNAQPQIKVAMATCGIASGGRKIMNYFSKELQQRGVEAQVTPVGCMGLCYAEPTVEVTLVGKEPVIFGFVDEKRAADIIENYIGKGETVGGIIPTNY